MNPAINVNNEGILKRSAFGLSGGHVRDSWKIQCIANLIAEPRDLIFK